MKKRQVSSLSLLICLVMVITVFITGCGGNGASSGGSSSQKTSNTQTIGGDDTSQTGDGTQDTSNGETTEIDEDGQTGPTGSKPGSSGNTTTKPSTGGTKAPVREVDLKGRTIKIGTVFSEEYNQEPGQSVYSDLFRQKEIEVENMFNCKIEFVRIAPGSVETIIANAVQANSAPYDLVEADIASVRNLSRAKALIDQKTLSAINLNDKRFIKAVNDSYTFNGKVFGSGFENGSITGVLFNKRILQANKQPDIYKLYDKGEWTFEAFRQIAKATTTPYKDDKTRDVYGITGATNIIGLALTSNAGATVSRNSSGKYVIDMASEKGVDAMNWVRQLMFEDSVYDYTLTDWKGAVNHFAEGKATFFPFYAWIARDLSQTMIDDIGFVPFPKGPGQSTYINGLYGGKAFIFPKVVKNPNDVAKVYYEYASVSAKLWQVLESQYKGWGFDDKSFTIFKDVATKYSRPEFSVGPDYSGFSKEMNESVFKRTGNPASVMASVKSKFQKATDDYYNAFP
ncbi:MAG: extracellular solute-binding protein [Oscillospiraceae bacterium]|nr:extracellular solute-binding protein [Oscillospiraceae bacterium]MDD4413527.1 extracellular solute-binding protein [Oscillospiraceae bacterium]